ncbi:short-chain dehydrogenase/reductase SDR [Calocera viscosa TUFC12733]|uniref:Short-chain dehydrogenase/reductase SDR n=1 Tax=Calocera viscosa (strain TUFC12733) TaxID=1330018 RepID=A0A167PK16_CALVF|nr:short-chain dehydrogenase/reductase SDR [Calocera viscosa TUFC12733]
MSIATAQNAPSIRHLVGKHVVVVGGTSGIGYCVAQASLEHGATVVVSSSSQEKVDATVSRLLKTNPLFEGSISGLSLNARDVKSIQAFWDKVGKVDHLVWTANGGRLPNFTEDDLDKDKAVFEVAFWGPVVSVKYAYKKGLFNPGASVTMTSGTVVRRPSKGFTISAAGAGAVETITRGLAVELAPIRVNTVSPGAVKTELWDSHGLTPEVQAVLIKRLVERTLVKHVGQPEEVAEAYLFLMKCTYMTGQTIDCEGGALLGA